VGVAAHQFQIGDIIQLKGDRVTQWKIRDLLDTPSGIGYRIVPTDDGAIRAVRDDKVAKRVYTAEEWAAETEQGKW
jgi:hypothetical protein